VPTPINCIIRNCGDSPLRYLYCACTDDTEVDERVTSVQVVDIRSIPVIPLIGWGQSVIFSSETLRAVGSKKLNFCAVNSLSPDASLNAHIPTGRSEETMYVTRGYGAIIIGEEQEPVEPGSLTYVNKDTMHSVQNTGKETLDFFVLESQKC
jgi:oxalate decarboxylase/phosphoglucose isomerase-like protein (cupin superfamily)